MFPAFDRSEYMSEVLAPKRPLKEAVSHLDRDWRLLTSVRVGRFARTAASTTATATIAIALVALHVPSARAAGGPLGVDARVGGDATGIWSRGNQKALQIATPLLVTSLALWEGDGTRLGHASWQSFDSLVIAVATSESMKLIFSRARPSQTNDPNAWFQGRGHRSFPSGEVMEMATAITPFVLEYGQDHPSVYALELLPIYDAIARLKSHAHWQTDVLASWAIGTGIGYYAHSRNTSIAVQVLPRGISIGWKTSF